MSVRSGVESLASLLVSLDFNSLIDFSSIMEENCFNMTIII